MLKEEKKHPDSLTDMKMLKPISRLDPDLTSQWIQILESKNDIWKKFSFFAHNVWIFLNWFF